MPSRTAAKRQSPSFAQIAAVETLEDRRLLTVVMSPHEQLLLELVNRARQDPQAEAARFGVSVEQVGFRAPLAPNQLLINAAAANSQQMLDLDYFSHTAPDGSTPLVRVQRAGYNPTIVGENIAWVGTTGVLEVTQSTFQLHRNLFLSPDHRAGMLDTRMREIGTGVRMGEFIDYTNGGSRWNALMATELFASRFSNYFITGVAFTDTVVDDAFYTVAEGMGNVLVTARNQSTGVSFTTFTGPSGGYSLEVPNGVYTVTFSGEGLVVPSVHPNISVNNANRKVDFDQSSQRATTLPTNFIVTGADAGGGPHVRVFDAQTGFEWMSLFPYNPGFTGGVRVATGDLNADGVLDIITAPGAGGGPHVRAFDGRTGAVLADFMAYDIGFRGGVFVAAADVNGDGRADIITGPGAGGGPHVRVFNGVNSQLITEFMAYAIGMTAGVHVAAGNVDGSGFADIITGPGAGGGPHVRVFNGSNGQPVNTAAGSFFAYSFSFIGGVWVATADVNSDGRSDIITGAGAGGGPHVRVFSGLTGGELNSFMAYSLSFNGGVRVAASDVDNNGVPDIITAAGPGGGPHVRAFHGTQPFALATGASSLMAYSLFFSGGVHAAGGRNQTLALIQTPSDIDAFPQLGGTLASPVETSDPATITDAPLGRSMTADGRNLTVDRTANEDGEESLTTPAANSEAESPTVAEFLRTNLDDLFADRTSLGNLLSF